MTNRIQAWLDQDQSVLSTLSPEQRRAFSLVAAGLATEDQMDAAGDDLVAEIKEGIYQNRVRSCGALEYTAEGKASQNEDGSYPWVFSDETVDRDGDIIRVKGWDLRSFRKNPVVLYGHGRETSEPIGRAMNVRVMDVRGNASLVGDIKFASEESELAARIELLVRGKFLTASSVGFIPKKVTRVQDEAERASLGLGRFGVIFERQELLENSVVSVPSNPSALRLGVKSGEITEADADLAGASMTEKDWEKYVRAKSRSFVSFSQPDASDEEVKAAPSFDMGAVKDAFASFSKQVELSNSALRDALLDLADGQKMVARALTHLRSVSTDDGAAAAAGLASDVGKGKPSKEELSKITDAVNELRAALKNKE